MKKYRFIICGLVVWGLCSLSSSCTKDSSTEPPFSGKTATLTVTAEKETTRTYVDENNKIHWSETGERIGVFYAKESDAGVLRYATTSDDYTVKDNGAAVFSLMADSEYAGYFWAFYPGMETSAGITLTEVPLVIPAQQTPTETSFDPQADLLISKYVVTAVDNTVNFSFHRVVAFAKMRLQGVAPGEKISSITLVAPGTKLAGSCTANLLNGSVNYAPADDSAAETLTLAMNGREASGEDLVWFSVMPADLSGKKLTVEVVTETNIYRKEIDFTNKTLKFEAARVSEFIISGLTPVKRDVYKLMTRTSELKFGDKSVIGRNNFSGETRLMSKNKFSTSLEPRWYASTDELVVVDESLQIMDLSSDTQIITLKEGYDRTTFSMETAEGYLNAGVNTEDELMMDVQSDVTKAASWTISCDGGIARIYSADKTTRALSGSSSTSYFNLTTSPGNVYIYYCSMGGSSAPLTALPTPTGLSATASGKTVTVAWNPVDGAASYDVTCGTEVKQGVLEATVEFEMAEYAVQYNVSVIANPADPETNTSSLAATTTVSTEADPNAGQVANTALFDFATMAASPEKPDSPDGVMTEDGCLMILTRGSWQSEGLGVFLGSGKTISIEGQNGKQITQIVMTPGTGKDIKIGSWSTDLYEGIYDESSYTWKQGEGPARYVEFETSAASTIARIEVTYE